MDSITSAASVVAAGLAVGLVLLAQVLDKVTQLKVLVRV